MSDGNRGPPPPEGWLDPRTVQFATTSSSPDVAVQRPQLLGPSYVGVNFPLGLQHAGSQEHIGFIPPDGNLMMMPQSGINVTQRAPLRMITSTLHAGNVGQVQTLFRPGQIAHPPAIASTVGQMVYFVPSMQRTLAPSQAVLPPLILQAQPGSSDASTVSFTVPHGSVNPYLRPQPSVYYSFPHQSGPMIGPPGSFVPAAPSITAASIVQGIGIPHSTDRLCIPEAQEPPPSAVQVSSAFHHGAQSQGLSSQQGIGMIQPRLLSHFEASAYESEAVVQPSQVSPQMYEPNTFGIDPVPLSSIGQQPLVFLSEQQHPFVRNPQYSQSFGLRSSTTGAGEVYEPPFEHYSAAGGEDLQQSFSQPRSFYQPLPQTQPELNRDVQHAAYVSVPSQQQQQRYGQHPPLTEPCGELGEADHSHLHSQASSLDQFQPAALKSEPSPPSISTVDVNVASGSQPQFRSVDKASETEPDDDAEPLILQSLFPAREISKVSTAALCLKERQYCHELLPIARPGLKQSFTYDVEKWNLSEIPADYSLALCVSANFMMADPVSAAVEQKYQSVGRLLDFNISYGTTLRWWRDNLFYIIVKDRENSQLVLTDVRLALRSLKGRCNAVKNLAVLLDSFKFNSMDQMWVISTFSQLFEDSKTNIVFVDSSEDLLLKNPIKFYGNVRREGLFETKQTMCCLISEEGFMSHGSALEFGNKFHHRNILPPVLNMNTVYTVREGDIYVMYIVAKKDELAMIKYADLHHGMRALVSTMYEIHCKSVSMIFPNSIDGLDASKAISVVRSAFAGHSLEVNFYDKYTYMMNKLLF